MAICPISFSDLVNYADKFEVDDFELFCYLIQHMDEAYLKYQSDKDKSKAKSK